MPKHLKRNLSCTLITIFLSATASAQPDYKCTIERVHRASSDSDAVTIGIRKAYVGKEFTVDRATGTMVGSLKNSYATKPVVVDRGSPDNAFKAVTTMRADQGVGSGSTVFTLVVNEYVDGKKKPFVFLSNDDVYFGACVHF